MPIDSLRFIAAEQRVVIAASKLGKLKTVFQMIAITLYMLLAFNFGFAVPFMPEGIWLDIWAYACVFILVVATVLSIWSGTEYVVGYFKLQRRK